MKGTKYIVCDNEICDFIEYTDSIDPNKWINKPCPKCNQNLMTQRDYDMQIKFEESMKLIENLSTDQLKNLEELGIQMLKSKGINTKDINDNDLLDIQFYEGIKLKLRNDNKSISDRAK